MKERQADHRYASFDYCYNHFNPNNSKSRHDTEKGCLMLFSYLASWGMLRGSSWLLKEANAPHFRETVEYIQQCEPAFWDIDVDNYTKNDNANIKTILVIAKDIRQRVEKRDKGITDTLVTKILLGVFGFVPALDSRFRKTFRMYSSLDTSLLRIADIYRDNKMEIKRLPEYKTLDFETGKSTNLRYTKAKIIDMYGFMRNEPFDR